jgi:fatty-acyl-CoA synthase
MRKQYDALGMSMANHVALSPISFLKRAAQVYARHPAVTYGTLKRGWAEFARRCRSVAGGLAGMGLGRGDTVSVLSPNIPENFELHFAVPLSGAVLNTINTRLEPETVAYILRHSDSKFVIYDTALVPLLRLAFALNNQDIPVIEITDTVAGHNPSGLGTPYETLAQAAPCDWALPEDETQPLALNYTSGTSSKPKGVAYHHRGAYLMAMGTVAGWSLPQPPTCISVVPMFYCNGWNHPWALAIVGGHMVFTRDALPEKLLAAIEDHRVTHLGAAPIVLQMLVESPHLLAAPFSPRIKVLTAGAPPPPSVLERARALGLEVMQVYGLTGTFGHISQCLWQNAWAAPHRHPAVQVAAVVARPPARWGESPCAFMELRQARTQPRPRSLPSAEPSFRVSKRPRRSSSRPCPKTATGKIQKFLLREAAKALAEQS